MHDLGGRCKNPQGNKKNKSHQDQKPDGLTGGHAGKDAVFMKSVQLTPLQPERCFQLLRFVRR